MSFKWLPFSYHWLLDSACGNEIKTVLDVGCGDGKLMKDLAEGKGWQITGVDIYKPSIKAAREIGIYKKVMLKDLKKISKDFLKQQYDLVFCSQVVEHLPKKDALKLIANIEKLAKKRVVVSTTVGFMNFRPIEDGSSQENPYQKHRSSWKVLEFTKMGYKVFGQGLWLVYREGNLAHTLPKFLHPFLFVIAFIFSPLVLFFPNLGTYQIAFKKI